MAGSWTVGGVGGDRRRPLPWRASVADLFVGLLGQTSAGRLVNRAALRRPTTSSRPWQFAERDQPGRRPRPLRHLCSAGLGVPCSRLWPNLNRGPRRSPDQILTASPSIVCSEKDRRRPSGHLSKPWTSTSSRTWYHRVRRSPRPGHALTIDSGWREERTSRWPSSSASSKKRSVWIEQRCLDDKCRLLIRCPARVGGLKPTTRSDLRDVEGLPRSFQERPEDCPEGPWDPTKIPRIQFCRGRTGAPCRLSAGGFPRPALRTGRAALTASGSPRVHAAGAGDPVRCSPMAWGSERPGSDSEQSPLLWSEHLGPAVSDLPVGQKATVEGSPVQSEVTFAQPANDPPPCEVIEVAERA